MWPPAARASTISVSTKPGVRGDEPEAAESLDRATPPQELSQAGAVLGVGVGVDGLAEEHDLGETPIDEVANLLQDLRRAAAAFPAAREGHDAEGAELIAAFDDRHKGLESGAAANLAELVDGRIPRQIDRDLAAPRGSDALDDLSDALDLARPEHEVDLGRALQDLVGFDLRDAARHADDEPGRSCFKPPRTPSSLKTFASAFSRTEQVFRSTTPRLSPSPAAENPATRAGPPCARRRERSSGSPRFRPDRRAYNCLVLNSYVDRGGARHSRIHPGIAPATRAFSGRSARSFSAWTSCAEPSELLALGLSQAGLMTRSRYCPSSQR